MSSAEHDGRRAARASQDRRCSKPRQRGSNSTCSTPMIMPTTPRIEPTDRSMLRVTMTSTMPVAMIATEAVWTDRFQRLRGVRNTPPERMSKPTQMTAARRSCRACACRSRASRKRAGCGARRRRGRGDRCGHGMRSSCSVISGPRSGSGIRQPLDRVPRTGGTFAASEAGVYGSRARPRRVAG